MFGMHSFSSDSLGGSEEAIPETNNGKEFSFFLGVEEEWSLLASIYTNRDKVFKIQTKSDVEIPIWGDS
jgi:hypothetical protein